jgi:benzaldehyde dehydrogenase (NAD)
MINLMIAGEARSAAANKTFERRHPVSGDVATIAAAASPEDAIAAVDAAQAAFPAWAATSPSAQRALLLKAAEALSNRASDFLAAMSAELGAGQIWVGANIELAKKVLIEAAALTTQIVGETLPTDQAGVWSLSLREPAGVVLGIAPWNAPLVLGARAIAVPLACGNTVVFKGSEVCPATHWILADVFREAGFPPGVVNFVTHAAEDAAPVVEALIAHPAVRRVNFTGSTRVGRRIGALAGQHLKPVVLELGGKAPLVVLEDADIEAAAAAASFGAFANQGQICMSTERVVAVGSAAEPLVAALVARAETLNALDLSVHGAALGIMVDAASCARAEDLIEDARAKGGRVLCGGVIADGRIAPTVIDGVTRDMRLYDEESFAPLLAIIRVADADAAVAVANDAPYGLSAAVFGENLGQTLSAARRIQSGICHINGTTVGDEPQSPFGGVKDSGFGRFGGRAGIEAFTELRWVTIATQRQTYPF